MIRIQEEITIEYSLLYSFDLWKCVNILHIPKIKLMRVRGGKLKLNCRGKKGGLIEGKVFVVFDFVLSVTAVRGMRRRNKCQQT